MKIIQAIAIAVLLGPSALAQRLAAQLPPNARVIETSVLSSIKARRRALVLWMINPKQNPLGYGPDEYTCPDATRGNYFEGPTRVSLLDTATGKIINTIKIAPDAEADTFDIPYRIRDGYYSVPNLMPNKEGRPHIMLLKDYNGDGRKLEFAFFNAEACMGLGTTLIGYSTVRDRVWQYPIVLVENEGDRIGEMRVRA